MHVVITQVLQEGRQEYIKDGSERRATFESIQHGVRPVLVKTALKLNSLHKAKDPVQNWRSYDQNIKDCTEAQMTHGNWRPPRECSRPLTFHLPTWLLLFTSILETSHSINITSRLLEKYFWWFDNSSDIAAELPSAYSNPCSSLFFLDLWRYSSGIH